MLLVDWGKFANLEFGNSCIGMNPLVKQHFSLSNNNSVQQTPFYGPKIWVKYDVPAIWQ